MDAYASGLSTIRNVEKNCILLSANFVLHCEEQSAQSLPMTLPRSRGNNSVGIRVKGSSHSPRLLEQLHSQILLLSCMTLQMLRLVSNCGQTLREFPGRALVLLWYPRAFP